MHGATYTARERLLVEAQRQERAAVAAGEAGDPLDMFRYHVRFATELRAAALEVYRMPDWAADDHARRLIASIALRENQLTGHLDADQSGPGR